MKYLIMAVLLLTVGGAGAYFYVTDTVHVFLDKDSGGWMGKKSDYGFRLWGQKCYVQWNAVHYKSGQASLSSRVLSGCQLNFKQQLAKHRIILAKINQKWPLKSFDRLHWGSFCAPNTKKWCRDIILKSRNAPSLRAFIKKYPLSGWKGPSELYLSLGKATKQYKALESLLAEFGLKIGKLDIEKVEKARLDKIGRLYDIQFVKPYYRRARIYPWVVFGGSNLTFELLK